MRGEMPSSSVLSAVLVELSAVLVELSGSLFRLTKAFKSLSGASSHLQGILAFELVAHAERIV